MLAIAHAFLHRIILQLGTELSDSMQRQWDAADPRARFGSRCC
jgi:hypothetical protein